MSYRRRNRTLGVAVRSAALLVMLVTAASPPTVLAATAGARAAAVRDSTVPVGLATAPRQQAASVRTVNSAIVKRALSYFRARQTKAGGFRADRAAEQRDLTQWVIMAIAATGRRPGVWHRKGGKTPVQYLQTLDLARIAEDTAGPAGNAPNYYSKTILAYQAAGKRTLISRAGRKRIDLVTALLAYQDPQSGRFTPSRNGAGSYAAVNTTAYAILALTATGRASAQRVAATEWLQRQAAASGGFAWDPGGTPDVDTTGAVVQALRAAGVAAGTPVVTAALAYLKEQQQLNGGFSSFGGSTNVEATAYAAMAIRKAGQNPAASAWTKGGSTPLDYIRSKQTRSGAFYHFGTTLATPLLTTSLAVIALSGRASLL